MLSIYRYWREYWLQITLISYQVSVLINILINYILKVFSIRLKIIHSIHIGIDTSCDCHQYNTADVTHHYVLCLHRYCSSSKGLETCTICYPVHADSGHSSTSYPLAVSLPPEPDAQKNRQLQITASSITYLCQLLTINDFGSSEGQVHQSSTSYIVPDSSPYWFYLFCFHHPVLMVPDHRS